MTEPNNCFIIILIETEVPHSVLQGLPRVQTIGSLPDYTPGMRVGISVMIVRWISQDLIMHNANGTLVPSTLATMGITLATTTIPGTGGEDSLVTSQLFDVESG